MEEEGNSYRDEDSEDLEKQGSTVRSSGLWSQVSYVGKPGWPLTMWPWASNGTSTGLVGFLLCQVQIIIPAW